MTPRVALIGANGHGLSHRRVLAPLHEAGRLRLVGLADVRPIVAAADAPVPADTGRYEDYRELLSRAAPDVVVICTPPHTHLEIAVAALRHGADVLLEKPPVLTGDEHRQLAAVLAETGRACQVGFQALGSAALAGLCAAVGAGRLGALTGIGVAGSWQRSDGYYQRSPWAGRRSLAGRPVLDGALANPFAHALMQGLAIARAAGATEPRLVELERYRARPTIEVDDTACLRVTLDSGLPVTVAVSLCGEQFIPGEVRVQGTGGAALLEYPTDRLLLAEGRAADGDGLSADDAQPVPGRVSLLENLLAHRADPAVGLLAPLAVTEAFTAVLEVIQAAPEPYTIDGSVLTVRGEPPERHVTIAGINAVVAASARGRALFSELGVPWAGAPTSVSLAGAGTGRSSG